MLVDAKMMYNIVDKFEGQQERHKEQRGVTKSRDMVRRSNVASRNSALRTRSAADENTWSES